MHTMPLLYTIVIKTIVFIILFQPFQQAHTIYASMPVVARFSAQPKQTVDRSASTSSSKTTSSTVLCLLFYGLAFAPNRGRDVRCGVPVRASSNASIATQRDARSSRDTRKASVGVCRGPTRLVASHRAQSGKRNGALGSWKGAAAATRRSRNRSSAARGFDWQRKNDCVVAAEDERLLLLLLLVAHRRHRRRNSFHKKSFRDCYLERDRE